MTLAGMDVAEVRQLADQLRRAADQLHSLVSTVDGRVNATGWTGRDADFFKHQWWPAHRHAVLGAADTIKGLGQSASNNADEQERASAVHGGATAGGGPGPAQHAGPATSSPIPSQPTPHPAPSSAAAAGAVAWAQSYVGSDTRHGECLGFVSDAWASKDVHYWNQIQPGYWRGADTYPADIWGHFTGGTTGTDMNPPPGAFVFYSGTPEHPRDWSHVTLSIGGGQAVSTQDHVGSQEINPIHTETVDSRDGRYLGWWLPAS